VSLRLSVTNAKKPGAPRDYDFANGPVRLGRASTSDVVLEGDMVSRTHVLLEEVDGGWQVSHQGSITPTVKNGRAVKPTRPERLEDGDVLQVADHKVQVAIVMETVMPELEPLRDSFVARIDPEDADRTRVASSRGGPPATVPPAAPPSFPSAAPAAPFAQPAPPPPAAPRPGPAGRTVPTLAVFAGLPEPARLEFREVGRDYSLGRSATCDLCLPVGAVSRQHAFARYDGSRVYLRDAGARNPPMVNGRPIVGEVPLTHGDTVTVGSVELRFASEPEAPSAFPSAAQNAQGATVVLDRNAPSPFAAGGGAGGWSASPAAPAHAPAPGAGGGWDAVARGGDGPGWSPDPVPQLEPMASLPPEPEPLPVPPPAEAPDWSAMAAPPKVEAAPPPAFGATRAPPPAPAAPPPPAWDVPEASPAPAWEAPPPAAPAFSAPPPPAPPPPMIPPAPPPMPGAPAQPAPLAPPGPATGVSEAKVVARRAASHRGWLVAGIASMAVAVTVGLLLVVLAL
jgi:pSer/pThr/pTyr-binding forkhead associated (FHA) protein